MAKVIVWDEAPMGHNDLIEALDRLLQDLMGNNLPFGGKVVILGGHFALTKSLSGTYNLCIT